jgi:hypothetical protein
MPRICVHAGTYQPASCTSVIVSTSAYAALSQQRQQVLPEHNGDDLKSDFPLSLGFDMEAANVLRSNKICNKTYF